MKGDIYPYLQPNKENDRILQRLSLPNSSTTPNFSGIFGRITQAMDLAKDRAVKDRGEGIRLREGLKVFKRDVYGSQVRDELHLLLRFIKDLKNYFNGIDERTYSETGYKNDDYSRQSLLYRYLGGELIQNEFLSEFLKLGKIAGLTRGEFSIGDAAELAYGFFQGKGEVKLAEKAVQSSIRLKGVNLGGISGGINAASSLYSLVNRWGHNSPFEGAIDGASAGAYIGSHIVPGIGTVIGGVIGGIAGAVTGLIKTGKHKDQIARDALRDFLKEVGVIDDSCSLTLYDGTKYYIGFDGGHKLTNLDGSKRRPYNTDPSNPLTDKAIGILQPIAAMLTGGDRKLKNDLTGYLVNAALSNAKSVNDIKKNAFSIFLSTNLSLREGLVIFAKLKEEGKITEREYKVYSHDLYTLVTSSSKL
ncbi:MAG: hypothetical protein D6808_07150 [Candidatus Dadabacteria bacterium]|nr:MAG: hypothetical protein D6808_07150 [Candidatus Dadabacteria bacterium]